MKVSKHQKWGVRADRKSQVWRENFWLNIFQIISTKVTVKLTISSKAGKSNHINMHESQSLPASQVSSLTEKYSRLILCDTERWKNDILEDISLSLSRIDHHQISLVFIQILPYIHIKGTSIHFFLLQSSHATNNFLIMKLPVSR